MSGALDSKMRALAVSLIAKFGKQVTVTYRADGAYNIATGARAITTTTATPYATISDVTPGQVFASGGLILAGDKSLTIAADGFTRPQPGDTVTIDSVVWTIKGVVEKWSGELVAAYKVQVRK